MFMLRNGFLLLLSLRTINNKKNFFICTNTHTHNTHRPRTREESNEKESKTRESQRKRASRINPLFLLILSTFLLVSFQQAGAGYYSSGALAPTIYAFSFITKIKKKSKKLYQSNGVLSVRKRATARERQREWQRRTPFSSTRHPESQIK